MQEKCAEADIPFIVILLPTWKAAWPRAILKTLYRSNIHVLDLAEMTLEGFPYDGHPNPADHRRIAEAVAKSFVSVLVNKLADTSGNGVYGKE